MATAAPPRRGTQTGYGTCVGCRGTYFLDAATRLCRDCTELAARDAPAYCSCCGLLNDAEHPTECCELRYHQARYCPRDGWWLGTHARCQASA